MPMIAGMPPATDAPNSSRLPIFRARSSSSGPVFGNQQLVGGDDGFARAQRLAHPFAGGLEAADQLDDDVHVGREHVVDIFRPANVRGQRIDLFLFDAAIENVRQQQGAAGILRQNLRDGAADGAEADQRDLQMAIARRRLLRGAADFADFDFSERNFPNGIASGQTSVSKAAAKTAAETLSIVSFSSCTRRIRCRASAARKGSGARPGRRFCPCHPRLAGELQVSRSFVPAGSGRKFKRGDDGDGLAGKTERASKAKSLPRSATITVACRTPLPASSKISQKPPPGFGFDDKPLRMRRESSGPTSRRCRRSWRRRRLRGLRAGSVPAAPETRRFSGPACRSRRGAKSEHNEREADRGDRERSASSTFHGIVLQGES